MQLQFNYFSLYDILIGVSFLSIFFFLINKNAKEIEIDDIVYFRRNFYLKSSLVLLYSIYYFFLVGGGDTIAYWDGAICLNNLFWKSPSMYFEQLFNEPTKEMGWRHFDTNTGYPPGWIYRESESWFISKIMSFFAFVTFKSYIAASLFFAYITSISTFKLYQFIKYFKLHDTKHISFSVLFVPSISFWCSGITKDTIILISIIYIVINLQKIILKVDTNNRKKYLSIFLYSFIVFHVRDFILLVIVISFGVVLMARLANKFRMKPFQFYSIRILTILLASFIFINQGKSLSENEQVKQAEVVAKDFENNETYDGTRYSTGIIDFSPVGLLIGFVPAVIAGIYRPFIWEGLSLSLIFNGLESLYFFYLTWLFIKSDFFKKIRFIRRNEILVFAFVFSVLLAFMVGLTSGLLGVLVRFKAPVILFFLLILTVNFDKQKEILKQNKYV